ncbi:MAG: AAA family ATPase [Blastocatellia bacterium]|nr:AAA family ATPase [Blastocatellia bacterium]
MSIPIKSNRPNAVERLRKAIISQYPLLYLLSWEEDRVERMVSSIARSLNPPLQVYIWSISQGLTLGNEAIPDTGNALAVLEYIIKTPTPGFYLLKDFHREVEGNPVITRRLRDAYYALKDRGKFLCLVSPILSLPEELKKEIYLIEILLPGDDEIAPLVDYLTNRHFKTTITDEEAKRSLINGLKGLTFSEIQHVLNGIFYGKPAFSPDIIDQILLEKEQITKKDGLLEFIFPRYRTSDLGGYATLKNWLKKRSHLFTREAEVAGISLPKGLLMMGISGCGKSLAVKTISSLWNLPLFRLDMSNIFSGGYGAPENAFRRALAAVDALSPCLLWIDEIETGIVGVKEGAQGGSTTRIFATFLTWMQEKDSMVFVAATANRIDLLPAEFIRKGRFDQVFFLDLPTEEERKQIFTIHLQRKGCDIMKFDLVTLAKTSEAWNGAEIEQAIETASIEAYNEHVPLTMMHLIKTLSQTIPLSRTMTEQIKMIRTWALQRAINAS